MKRKPLKMGRCAYCGKTDGWNLKGMDHEGNVVTLCRTCHNTPCEIISCGAIASVDNPLVISPVYDRDGDWDEAQLLCSRCHEYQGMMGEVAMEAAMDAEEEEENDQT